MYHDSFTETNFVRWINAVSKFMGYRIDRKVVTVTEFLEMGKMMVKYQDDKKYHHKA